MSPPTNPVRFSKLERDRETAGIQVERDILPVGVCHKDSSVTTLNVGHGDSDPGNRGALLIGHRSAETAEAFLGLRDAGDGEGNDQKERTYACVH